MPPPIEVPVAPPEQCEPLPPAQPAPAKAANPGVELIDLATALRLANVKNPEIALARERIQEAFAKQQAAEALWLPNLEVNPTWLRHDGPIQRFNGDVEVVSRSSLMVGAGPALNFDWGDALFAKLAARQITEGRQAGAAAVSNQVLMDVALAYTQLLQTYAEVRVADDTYDYANKLYELMVSYEKVGKAPAADVARARVELKQRERERISVRGKIQIASARLVELIYLPPGTTLRPVEAALVPLTMVPADIALNELIIHGLRNRPELAEYRAYIEASLERWRSAKVAPWIPELRVIYNGGGYGGGRDSYFSNFDWRGDGGAMAYWKLDNLGQGNRAVVRERQSQYQQMNFRAAAVENGVAAQIAAAHGWSQALRQEIPSAIAAVQAAKESGELNLDRIRRAPEQGRPIELLQAIQAYERAQTQFVQVIADYNRAQFRLYTALGSPPQCGLEQSTPIPQASAPATAAEEKK